MGTKSYTTLGDMRFVLIESVELIQHQQGRMVRHSRCSMLSFVITGYFVAVVIIFKLYFALRLVLRVEDFRIEQLLKFTSQYNLE